MKNNSGLLRKLEILWESILWNTRLLVFIAVISSLISSFVLFTVGFYEVIHLLISFLGHYTYEEFYKKLLAVVIASVDLFLIATFLLVFAFGLYELFISKIDPAEENPQGIKVLVIKNLEDLKEKLGRLVIMVLIVAFFKQVLHMDFKEPLDILYIAVGILFVSLALYFTHKK
jgi:uncharacterized membrane protein YqhA